MESGFTVKILNFQSQLSVVEKFNDVLEWTKIILEALKELVAEMKVSNDTQEKQIKTNNAEIEILRGKIATQGAVILGIEQDWMRVKNEVERLNLELEDQSNYHRRMNLLLHGVDEDDGEDVGKKLMNVLR